MATMKRLPKIEVLTVLRRKAGIYLKTACQQIIGPVRRLHRVDVDSYLVTTDIVKNCPVDINPHFAVRIFKRLGEMV